MAQMGPECPPLGMPVHRMPNEHCSALPTPGQAEHPSLLRDARTVGCGSHIIEGNARQAQSPDGEHLFASWYISHPSLCQHSRRNTTDLCLRRQLLVHSPQANVTSTGQQHIVPGLAWSGVFSFYDSCCCCRRCNSDKFILLTRSL